MWGSNSRLVEVKTGINANELPPRKKSEIDHFGKVEIKFGAVLNT